LLAKENSIVIGKILKPFGINGSLKVMCLSDFPERFKYLKEVYLYDDRKDLFVENKKNDALTYKIDSIEVLQNFIKLKLAGFDDIEESDKLRNYLITIDENEKVKLPEDKFYYFELIGLNVHENDIKIGVVDKVDNYGGDDLIFVREANANSFYIPLRKEYILNIDFHEKIINVRLVDGMK
jgi:16S rRNA processing protein RimM